MTKKPATPQFDGADIETDMLQISEEISRRANAYPELVAALRSLSHAIGMTQITAPVSGIVQNRMAEAERLLAKLEAQ